MIESSYVKWNDPMLSVVLPTPSGLEALLIEKWDAYLTSTGLEYEMIAVDYASSHDSLDFDDPATAMHPKLRVLHIPGTCGQGVAFRAGIDAAHGSHVVTAGVDVWCSPSSFSDMLAYAEMYDLVRGKITGRRTSRVKRLLTTVGSALRPFKAGDPDDGHCEMMIFRRTIVDTMQRFENPYDFAEVAGLHGFSCITIPVESPSQRVGRNIDSKTRWQSQNKLSTGNPRPTDAYCCASEAAYILSNKNLSIEPHHESHLFARPDYACDHDAPHSNGPG